MSPTLLTGDMQSVIARGHAISSGDMQSVLGTCNQFWGHAISHREGSWEDVCLWDASNRWCVPEHAKLYRCIFHSQTRFCMMWMIARTSHDAAGNSVGNFGALGLAVRTASSIVAALLTSPGLNREPVPVSDLRIVCTCVTPVGGAVIERPGPHYGQPELLRCIEHLDGLAPLGLVSPQSLLRVDGRQQGNVSDLGLWQRCSTISCSWSA
jgi:hypothetical protein